MKIIGITSTAILSLLLGVAVPVYAQHQEQGDKQDHAKPQQGGHENGKPDPQHAQKPQPQHAQPQHAQQQNQQKQQQAQHNQQQAQQKQQQTQRNQQQAQRNQQQSQQKQQQAQRNQQQSQHNQQQAQRNQQQSQRNQQQAQRNQQQSQRNQQQAQHNQQQQRIQQSAWQQHRSQNWQSDHRNWQQRGGYRGYRIPDDRYRGYFGPSHGFRINTLPFLVVGGYPRFQYEGYWISAVDPWPSSWGDDWYDNDDVYVSYVDNGYYMYNRSYPGQGIAINISF